MIEINTWRDYSDILGFNFIKPLYLRKFVQSRSNYFVNNLQNL